MKIVNKFNNWRNYRKVLGELEQLSKRELADIGIYGDVRNAARKASAF